MWLHRNEWGALDEVDLLPVVFNNATPPAVNIRGIFITGSECGKDGK